MAQVRVVRHMLFIIMLQTMVVSCTQLPVSEETIEPSDQALIEEQSLELSNNRGEIIDGIDINMSYRQNGIDLSLQNQSGVDKFLRPNYASPLRFMFFDSDAKALDIRGWEGSPPPNNIKFKDKEKKSFRYESEFFQGKETISTASKICFMFEWKNSESMVKFQKKKICINKNT